MQVSSYILYVSVGIFLFAICFMLIYYASTLKSTLLRNVLSSSICIHGVTSDKIIMFLVTTTETSNPAALIQIPKSGEIFIVYR
jgi:hypothetical protein